MTRLARLSAVNLAFTFRIARYDSPPCPSGRSSASDVRPTTRWPRSGIFPSSAPSTFRWLWGWFRPKNIRLLFPLMYEVGVRSVPVIAVTGAFIGMVMAVETHTQFKSIGQEERIGSVISLIVVKQIGPVLAAVMLAGRIGGALTAELGTMNVTEQLDALRVMGSDPIRYLVVPRFIVCLLLLPILTIYSDLLGVLGGWSISTKFLGVADQPYWYYAPRASTPGRSWRACSRASSSAARSG
jgi:phospholipid/cholesterol/gamma-HCH transport system permease protein